MITAEEFFRNKIKEQNPNREVITLSQELITAEQGMRWANEFKQLPTTPSQTTAKLCLATVIKT